MNIKAFKCDNCKKGPCISDAGMPCTNGAAWMDTACHSIIKNEIKETKSNVPDIPKVPPMPGKKPELTLQKAIPKMKNGDSFKKIDNKHPTDDSTAVLKNNSFYWESDGSEIKLTVGTLSMIGKIIPAEPKVLNAGEIRYEVIKNNEYINIPDSSKILKAARLGIKSGNQEQWLALKPIIDLCKELFTSDKTIIRHRSSVNIADELKEQLENLKPLDTDDLGREGVSGVAKG